MAKASAAAGGASALPADDPGSQAEPDAKSLKAELEKWVSTISTLQDSLTKLQTSLQALENKNPEDSRVPKMETTIAELQEALKAAKQEQAELKAEIKKLGAVQEKDKDGLKPDEQPTNPEPRKTRSGLAFIGDRIKA